MKKILIVFFLLLVNVATTYSQPPSWFYGSDERQEYYDDMRDSGYKPRSTPTPTYQERQAQKKREDDRYTFLAGAFWIGLIVYVFYKANKDKSEKREEEQRKLEDKIDYLTQKIDRMQNNKKNDDDYENDDYNGF